ncbi:MAG: restriction endonuclease, partial [Acidobacteriota bacterium]|nr:restriction endonuclease [Acidobacteriota bacterium]
MLPLYEAKMIHLYDTRWATYEADGSTRLMTADEKAKRLNPMPRYWVAEIEIDKKLAGRWDR